MALLGGRRVAQIDADPLDVGRRRGERGEADAFVVEDELLAEHLTAEYRVKTEGRGRTVDEWKLRVAGLDNHWLDCLVGSAVAASMQGAVLFGTDLKPTSKPRVRLSELKRQHS